MTDDIVTRLREAYKNADEVASVFLTNEAANEIEKLVTQLRIQAEVVNGKNYHTISGGLHLDAADEIERLRSERDQFRKFWSYAIHERNELFDTAFPTNENYTSFIHPDAKGDS